jgi:hypothetical protein
MAVDAGIPGANGLARLIEDAAALHVERADDLAAVTAALEASRGEEGAQELIRSVVLDCLINSTAPLRALAAACRGGIILTTNYDDAVELSTVDAGLHPVSMELADALSHGPIARDEVGVLHLHGRAAGAGPLVLPGRSTLLLSGSALYQAVLASMLAPHPVVYFGFRLGPHEIPLHNNLAMIATYLSGAAQQVLIVSAEDVAKRREQIDALLATGLITLAPYEGSHEIVAEFAMLFAPRGEALSGTVGKRVEEAPEGWLMPRMVHAAIDTAPAELDQMVFSTDHGIVDATLRPEALVEATCALLIGSPGMGKTELLAHLARDSEQPPAVVCDLRSVAAQLVEGEEIEMAVARALAGSSRAGRDGIPTPSRDVLDQGGMLILLDSLDEVRSRRGEVAAAVAAATERWPGHRWVVASRPVEECRTLTAAGFEVFRLWPSVAWGSEFLDRRGIVGSARGAMEESGGFNDLISIPLFAAAAADRLIAGDLPDRPIDLLVDLQRAAANTEQAREALEGSLFEWVQRLAIGLEVRGRESASIAELSAVLGRGAPEAAAVRERLIRSTLLAELPDVASFQRRTFQEALCAEAVLGHPDVAGFLQEIAEGETAGERDLRSDIEFTIDLIFENADCDQRAALRQLDQLRWARTVVSRGSETDADEAFDVIWSSVSDPPSTLSAMADQSVRSIHRAVAAIGRKWPSVIERRRDALIEQSRDGVADRRYNAIVALGVVRPGDDEDVGWMLERVADANEGVARIAVSALRSWRLENLTEPLWSMLNKVEQSDQVWGDVIVALAEFAREPADFERVARKADRRLVVLHRLIAHLTEHLPRDRQIEMLADWPSDPSLWQWTVERLLSDGDSNNWTDRQVESLIQSLIRRRVSVADLASTPRLARFLVDHGELTLAGVQDAARTWVSGNHTIFSMLWALPPETREVARRSHPGLEGYLQELASHFEAYPPPSKPISWADRVAAQLDDGIIDQDHPLAATNWPHDLDERHLLRLGELSEAWWPQTPLDEVDPHGLGELSERTIAALSAGAAAGRPLFRERWLEILGAPTMLDIVPSAYRWLSQTWQPAWQNGVIALVETAEDAHALSRIISAVPVVDGDLLRAIVTQLPKIDQDARWNNVVGLLQDLGHGEALRPLLSERLAADQRQSVLRALADTGDAEAQLALLDMLLKEVQDGQQVQGFRWSQPVTRPSVIQRLGDLILLLPHVPMTPGWRTGLEPRSSAEGILAVAETEVALDVYDRLIAADTSGKRYDLARAALLRRLVTLCVLARLPEALADAAALVLDRE